MERAALRQPLSPLGRIAGCVPAAPPGFIEPCLATLRADVPSGSDWIHELQYDGRRTQAHLLNGKRVLYTGEGLDCSRMFASVTQSLQLFAAREAVLDGEVVVLDERGAADPNELQRDIDVGRTDRLGLVAIGAIELHPWNCSVDDLDHPNVLVFDLEALDWRAVTKAAFTLRNMLAEDGLASWPNLTGTNGIQVMAPLESRVTYDLVQRYSAALAQRVIAKDPANDGRLFIHTEGNYRGWSTLGTYSPRARPGFPIVAPVSWKRIERGIHADAFAITHPFHAS